MKFNLVKAESSSKPIENPAVMANPLIEITKTLSKSAVASENRKIGNAMLNFTERNKRDNQE